jgi:cation diffusion facilitator family transporter
MHVHNLHQWKHTHRFHIDDGHGERNTWRVIMLTAFMMVIEIVAGLAYGSMALLADGWHMGTHAAALGITVFAYRYARRHADDQRYSFGTGKVTALGGWSSAVVLAIVALLMAIESFKRLILPKAIQFNEAIVVAVLGLMVNLISAFLLQAHHYHDHDHNSHDTTHHDHNLRGAYLHVLADALTSLLAIIALFTGKAFGWVWMDPMMGVVGSVIIVRWAYSLLRDTGMVLLDSGVDQETVAAIISAIESDSDNKVSDIHVWQICCSRHLASAISIVTHYPKSPEYYKELLAGFKELAHVTVEVSQASGEPCLAPSSFSLT